jgi:hypothetical protein
MSKNVIVFGGTGHQGSAFVNALAGYNKSSASPAWTIHLLVRNPEAPAAERLARLNGVKVVHAPHYMESPDEAFDAAGLEVGDVHGAFLVCGYMDGEKEVAQGESCWLFSLTRRRPRRQVGGGPRRQAHRLWLGYVRRRQGGRQRRHGPQARH